VPPRPAERASLAEALSGLDSLGLEELRAEWRRLHRAPCPALLSPNLLRRGIAHRLQERALGGLSASARRQIASLARSIDGALPEAAPQPVRLRTGTSLLRAWGGRTHTVLVQEDGFEHEGRRYASLSEVARTITGAHWSGPRFFGLRNPGPPPRMVTVAERQRSSSRRLGRDTVHAAPGAGPTRRRCAIYTRKSSEEGLEQAFNSLDAQRDACEAFVRSQRHEGWVALPARYDDGGLSGGTLERPALQQLLADIRQGKVDLIVVYKVDRLTRSLADFAKLVDVLDAQGVSFVSVTQQFNTATSMGRLTLNMLLSFAQFEREVTGERIRDKFAASRRKGLWMGGTVPLGYRVQDRKLVVDEGEAERVRHILRRYAELGSVLALKEELADQGILSKAGRPFSRGALFHLLQNRLYRGEVVHKGQVYPGEHAAIVEEDLWQAVQQRLASNRQDRSPGRRSRNPALLLGLAHDASGDRLTPSHAIRRGVRYRYYVSHRLVTGGRHSAPDGRRIPASDLERLVVEALMQFLADPPRLLSRLGEAELLPRSLGEQQELTHAAGALVSSWPQLSPEEQRDLLHRLLTRIDVTDEAVTLHADPACLRDRLLGSEPQSEDVTRSPILLSVPATLMRAGRETALVLGEQDTPAPTKRNPALVRLIVRAHAIYDAVLASSEASLESIAAREGISGSYLARLVRLAYLSPSLTEAILAGTQPATITPSRLMRDTRLPLDWQEQQQLLTAA
jgi:DNA invertase Pin-like site-specific DNA recombinase